MNLLAKRTSLVLPLFFSALSSVAFGFSIDGEGHYAIRGETQTAPAFSKQTGMYQAIEQSFRLQGEARFNDMSSMFLEMRLFDNPREAYLGDDAPTRGCDKAKGETGKGPNGDECHGPQNSGEPRYEPYTPKIYKAYVRYAFDYCILEAGRRGRDWGLGIFLDSGTDPFEKDASVFDGVSCDINVQKSSTLGFKVGYDKLSETGNYVAQPDPNANPPEPRTRRFGANDVGDDLDQYFFSIEYDDRKANAGEAFTKQIGVYFAQVNSRDYKRNGSDEEIGGSATDLKFLDLYTGFFLADLAFRNEIMFRMGKSADPNWRDLGGGGFSDGEPERFKLDAIALAGSLEWTLARSGAAIGPTEYNRGDASRHALFLNYAYAPGDQGGYYDVDSGKRDKAVKAVAFHRNFKPALILFNARPEADKYAVDGAFDPGRVENATVLGTGYRFESIQNGNFEVKLLTAKMIATIPSDVKSSLEASATTERPAGFYGSSLGYELDLTYSYKVGREAELGIAAGAAAPGDAWKTNEDSKPTNDFLIQSFAAFRF